MAGRLLAPWSRGLCLSITELEEGEEHCPIRPLIEDHGSHSDTHLVIWEPMEVFSLIMYVADIVMAFLTGT